MPISPEFRDYVLEMLQPFGPVRAKAMFGGAGLYADDTMFALIANDVLYFRTDEGNVGEYEAAGCSPFQPFEHKPFKMPYYEAPPDIMEDADELSDWARRAWEAARRNQKKKGGKKKPKSNKD